MIERNDPRKDVSSLKKLKYLFPSKIFRMENIFHIDKFKMGPPLEKFFKVYYLGLLQFPWSFIRNNFHRLSILREVIMASIMEVIKG